MNEKNHKKNDGLDRVGASKTTVKRKKSFSSSPAQEIRWDPDAVFKENKYYIRIASKFKLCKYIIAALTLIFTVVMLTVFSSDITSENFQYLIKDLDITGLTSEGDFASIVFNGGTNSKFGIYRGELAVINSGLTSLYSSSGAFSFSKSNIFYSPELLVSNKYMLVYDSGNTTCSYSIYNSFAELKNEKMSYPITGAALSDNGAYAIVSRDSSYKGVLLWYDKDFNLLTEIKKDKYIISSALTSDGTELALASVYDDGGDAVTELMTVTAGSESASASLTVTGVMPMMIRYLEDGNIAVLYTDRMVFYNGLLEELSSVSLSSLLSVKADIGKKLVCIVNNNTLIGNDKTVNIYNSGGELLYTSGYAGELLKLRSFENRAYLLFEDRMVMIDLADGTERTVEADPNAIDLVFTSSGLPVMCYAGSAIPVIMDDLPESES